MASSPIYFCKVFFTYGTIVLFVQKSTTTYQCSCTLIHSKDRSLQKDYYNTCCFELVAFYIFLADVYGTSAANSSYCASRLLVSPDYNHNEQRAIDRQSWNPTIIKGMIRVVDDEHKTIRIHVTDRLETQPASKLSDGFEAGQTVCFTTLLRSQKTGELPALLSRWSQFFFFFVTQWTHFR